MYKLSEEAVTKRDIIRVTAYKIYYKFWCAYSFACTVFYKRRCLNITDGICCFVVDFSASDTQHNLLR